MTGHVTRVRLRFTKLGKVRFTSHRDVARMIERMARKASLPIAYSEGFSPRPRMHFGLALPTGCASLGEYVDLDLTARVDIDSLPGILTARLPTGMAVVSAAEVVLGERSLQESVTSCDWRLRFVGMSMEDAEAAVSAVLAAESLEVTRQRNRREVTEDIRPGIRGLSTAHWGSDSNGGRAGVDLVAELAAKPRAVRPDDLVRALGSGWEPALVCRDHQWIDSGELRREPLSAPQDFGACAEVCAL